MRYHEARAQVTSLLCFSDPHPRPIYWTFCVAASWLYPHQTADPVISHRVYPCWFPVTNPIRKVDVSISSGTILDVSLLFVRLFPIYTETPTTPPSRKPDIHQTEEEEFQCGWRFTGDSSPNQEFHRQRIGKEKKVYKKWRTVREIDVVSVKILLWDELWQPCHKSQLGLYERRILRWCCAAPCTRLASTTAGNSFVVLRRINNMYEERTILYVYCPSCML